MREECSGPYLKMLIKLWPGYWIDQLERMIKRLMKKMGNIGLKLMFGIGNFVASQAVNSGRTLVVSFQRLHLVLEGRVCGRRKRNKS